MLASGSRLTCAACTTAHAEARLQRAPTAAIAMHGSSRQLPCTRQQLHQQSARLRGAHAACRSRHTARRSLTVFAGWGDPVEWSAARIVESKPAAEGMQQLLVDIGSLAEGYTVPGQFLQAKVGDLKPGFFAIASPPDPNNQGVIQLLVKTVPDSTAEKLVNSREGDSVDVSPVMGKGFQISKLPSDKYSTVYLFATGSGIAPIKALLESSDLQATERDSVKLYYGTRSEQLTPFRGLVKEWEALGVQLVNVYSSAGHGYVQDVFAKEGGITNGAATGAVLCGQKQMCEQITQILHDGGVAKDDILLNF